MVLALLICIGSALGEMKGPCGGDQDNLQQGIDLIKAKGLGACGSAGSHFFRFKNLVPGL